MLPTMIGCDGEPVIDPGRVRVQVRLHPATPDQYERLDLRWFGVWQEPTVFVEDGQYPGDTGVSSSLDLDATQTSGLVEFPTVGNMRQGLWSFIMLIDADGEALLAEECLAEVFNLETNIVQFTEGGQGCICSFGCQPPAG